MEDWSEYIAGLVGPLTDYWGRLELEILKSIAERMSAADLYTASSAYEMKKLLEMGMVFDEVLEILAGGMRRTRQQVESIIGQAGLETLREESERLVGAADGGLIDTALSQRAYDFERTARQSLQRVLASEEPEAVILQQTIRAGAAATEQTFRNLTRTTALGASAQFGRALDAAYMQTTSGAFSATAAVERAVRQLSEHGIDAVIYPSGHVDTVEVAARRAIITGANQTSLLTREEIAVQYDLDLVEVSAHWGARPEHAEWQGGIYSRSGKSSKYQGLVEATGYGTGPGLGGWNCSHTFSSYIEGMPRTYTDEQLEEMKNATVEVDGKKIPYYEAQQKQRAMERTIRGYKRRAAAAESDAERYAAIAKEKEWREKYERFCASTGLKEQPERYQTGRGVDYSGYGKYITGESGGKRAKRAAELTEGFPALEDGAGASAGNSGASVGNSDTGRLASGAKSTRTTVEDVTKEYFDNATPGVGTVTVQEGYRIGKHKEEILIADYLHETFGGDIVLLQEKGGTEWPDYKWNELLWELKTNHSPTKNAVDKALQKALSQISRNPGGVLIDFKEGEIGIEKLKDIITKRFDRGNLNGADIMILTNGKAQAVLRCKK